jgi:hypothetical protein
MGREGLKVDDDSESANELLLSSPLELPKHVPSIETVLKMAVAKLLELDTSRVRGLLFILNIGQ